MEAVSAKEIFSRRLRAYRTASGLSMDDLVSRLDAPLSKNAISRYEKGEMMPESRVLLSIAKALGVSASDLLRPQRISIEKTEYRKKSKLGAKALRAIESRVMDRLERYIELEQILGIKSEFVNPFKERQIRSADDVEEAALKLRKAWDLGLSPVVSLLEILEEKEIKIIEVEEDEKFDGLCGYANEIYPFIVINKNHDPFRKRMTAIHELGHLLLNFSKSLPTREKERLSNKFSGAFLFPQANVLKHFGNHRSKISREELVILKEEYGISVAAIVFRLQDSGVISESQARQFWMSRNRDPQLKSEAKMGYWKYADSPDRFQRLLHRAMAEEFITVSKASDLSGIPQKELQESFSLV